MAQEQNTYSIEQEGYFGLSLLHLGSYGARMITSSFENPRHSALFCNESTLYYHSSERSLTVEELAQSPRFAIDALEKHANIARDMDEHVEPFTN